jgi:hypothetical protein
MLVFMLSTLSTSQAAKRGALGNNISLASKCWLRKILGQVFKPKTWYAARRRQVKVTVCVFYVKVRFSGHETVGSRTGAVFRRSGLSVCSPFPLGVPH